MAHDLGGLKGVYLEKQAKSKRRRHGAGGLGKREVGEGMLHGMAVGGAGVLGGLTGMLAGAPAGPGGMLLGGAAGATGGGLLARMSMKKPKEDMLLGRTIVASHTGLLGGALVGGLGYSGKLHKEAGEKDRSAGEGVAHGMAVGGAGLLGSLTGAGLHHAAGGRALETTTRRIGTSSVYHNGRLISRMPINSKMTRLSGKRALAMIAGGTAAGLLARAALKDKNESMHPGRTIVAANTGLLGGALVGGLGYRKRKKD